MLTKDFLSWFNVTPWPWEFHNDTHELTKEMFMEMVKWIVTLQDQVKEQEKHIKRLEDVVFAQTDETKEP